MVAITDPRSQPWHMLQHLTVVTQDAVQCLEAEIPSHAFPLHPLQKLNALGIVPEISDMMPQAQVRENLFPLMAEWRVTDVVSQGDRLDQILVESQKTADRPRHARYQWN